jgi:hypothetical protein
MDESVRELPSGPFMRDSPAALTLARAGMELPAAEAG